MGGSCRPGDRVVGRPGMSISGCQDNGVALGPQNLGPVCKPQNLALVCEI